MYLDIYIPSTLYFEVFEYIRECVREKHTKTTSVIMYKYNRLHPTGIMRQKAVSARRSRDGPRIRNNLLFG